MREDFKSARLEQLAVALAAAHRDKTVSVPGAKLAGLSMAEGAEVQALVMRRLGERAQMGKITLSDSGPAAAPIYDSSTGPSGLMFDLPARGILGIEIEIAVRLGRSITPEIAARGANGIRAAIVSYHVGIEIVGTRLADREAAGRAGQLADNINTAGYAWNESEWQRGADIDNIGIMVEVDGHPFYRGNGASDVGGILAPLIAYGRQPLGHFDVLGEGMLVTTGALCGLLDIRGPGHIRAAIDGNAVELTLR